MSLKKFSGLAAIALLAGCTHSQVASDKQELTQLEKHSDRSIAQDRFGRPGDFRPGPGPDFRPGPGPAPGGMLPDNVGRGRDVNCADPRVGYLQASTLDLRQSRLGPDYLALGETLDLGECVGRNIQEIYVWVSPVSPVKGIRVKQRAGRWNQGDNGIAYFDLQDLWGPMVRYSLGGLDGRIGYRYSAVQLHIPNFAFSGIQKVGVVFGDKPFMPRIDAGPVLIVDTDWSTRETDHNNVMPDVKKFPVPVGPFRKITFKAIDTRCTLSKWSITYADGMEYGSDQLFPGRMLNESIREGETRDYPVAAKPIKKVTTYLIANPRGAGNGEDDRAKCHFDVDLD